jgi:hypothetical protein
VSLFRKHRREERRRPQVEVNLLEREPGGGGLVALARRVWMVPALGAALALVAFVAVHFGGHQ